MPRRLSKSDRERIIAEVAELAKEPRERMAAVSPIGFLKSVQPTGDDAKHKDAEDPDAEQR